MMKRLKNEKIHMARVNEVFLMRKVCRTNVQYKSETGGLPSCIPWCHNTDMRKHTQSTLILKESLIMFLREPLSVLQSNDNYFYHQSRPL